MQVLSANLETNVAVFSFFWLMVKVKCQIIFTIQQILNFRYYIVHNYQTGCGKCFILVALRLSCTSNKKKLHILKFLLEKISNIDKSRAHNELKCSCQPPSTITSLLSIRVYLYLPFIPSVSDYFETNSRPHII